MRYAGSSDLRIGVCSEHAPLATTIIREPCIVCAERDRCVSLGLSQAVGADTVGKRYGACFDILLKMHPQLLEGSQGRRDKRRSPAINIWLRAERLVWMLRADC
jgi:hypothetical protein